MSVNFDNAKIEQTKAVNNINNSSVTSAAKITANIDLNVDNKIIEKLKSLGISDIEDQMAVLEKCQKAGIDINTVSNEDLQKIVTDYKSSKVSETKNSESVIQKPEKQPQTNEAKSDFKSEYNKKDLNGKIEDCYTALAKNIYTAGFKDKNGNDVLKPNSLGKSWDELSKAEQEQYIQKVKDFVDNDERLKSIKEQFVSTKNISNEEKTIAIDALMRGILAADQEGISYTDYLKKNEFERAEIVEQYLNTNTESLNQNDEYLKNQNQLLNQKVSDICKQQTGLDITGLDASDVKRYIKDLNLNEDELIYLSLKEKADKGILTDENEKRQYSYYSKVYGTAVGQERLKETKAQNLHNLELRYDELKAKKDLSPADKRSLEIIEKTINSDESKELKTLYSKMPQPTEGEKLVLDEVNEMLNDIEEHVQGSDLEAGFLVQAIERKFAGKTDEEKANYINTYLKYNKSDTANRVYAYFVQKGYDNLVNKETIDYGSLNIDVLTDKQSDMHHKNILEVYKSGNDYSKKQADLAIKTEHKILPKYGNDYKKDGYTDLTLETGNTEYINYGIDVNNSIEDDELKDKGIEKIFTHKNTKAENGIYALSKIKEAGKSQVKVLELTTGRWKEVTAYASENNVVADMDKEYQTKGFETLHSNINKHFEGEDAIKYSKSLSDQIQNCDKDNQLAMHKEIMTSKYSEVVEHAAGNIKNYDASVQPEAIEAVVATGNTAAIETAYTNLATSPNVVQDSANLRAIIELSLESSRVEELAQKIKQGATLTREEYDSLTDAQKQEYRAAYFQSLSPAKQVEIITKISDVATKKAVFKKIAGSNKNLLKSIIENDASSAEFVYNMHIADELVLSVAKRKSASVIQFANLVNKIEKSMEKSGRIDNFDNKQNAYMDSPFDALKVKDKKGKNNTYIV